jgi:branched-chain amino acid transport system ATP-binding protein
MRALAAAACRPEPLRRRGVYFSLLTLALSAMLYSVAFRWTEVTGGENGLGGISRPVLAGVSFESAAYYYALVAAIGFAAIFALWRFHRSPLGSVLVAIRENEQRARFIGYPTNRVKLTAFVASAACARSSGRRWELCSSSSFATRSQG